MSGEITSKPDALKRDERNISYFKRYLELSVPRTWLYALLSFLFGYIISGQNDPVLFITGIILFGPILTGATNLINMYYDTVEDEVNKPIRKEHIRVLQKENVKKWAFILYVLAIIISFMFDSIYFSVAIILYVLISYTYSAPPIRSKKRFMISLVMLAYGSVFLPFLSAWLIIGDVSSAPWGMAALSTSIVMFPIAGKDITDPIGDKKAGNRTLFTEMGFAEGMRFYSLWMLWLPYVVLIILILIRLIPLYMLVLLFFIPVSLIDTKRGLNMRTFVSDEARAYFRSVFWHIIELLVFSFFPEIIHEFL
jgi:chlorophyll synthase